MIKGRKLQVNRLNRAYVGTVFPAVGSFFEYRVSRDEFANHIKMAGFEIIEHTPFGYLDGLFHELNPLGLLISYHGYKFRPTRFGLWLNEKLSKYPFCHAHQQIIIATKPTE